MIFFPVASSSIGYFRQYVVQYNRMFCCDNRMFCCDIISDKNIAGPTNWEDNATSNWSTAHSSCVHTHFRRYHYLTTYTKRFEWLLYFHLQVNECHYSVLLKGSRVRSRLPSLTWKQTTDLSVRLSVRLHARQIPRLFICQTGREVNELKITKACVTLPTLCFHVMYQLNTLTIHDITVTSLLYVSAQICHLQGVHTKL
jgi:hypothetical protein